MIVTDEILYFDTLNSCDSIYVIQQDTQYLMIHYIHNIQ